MLLLAGCYTGAPANRDVAMSWRGRTRVELEERWGAPKRHDAAPPNDVMVWTYQTTRIDLPEGGVSVEEREVGAGAHAEVAGAVAEVGVSATVLDVSAAFKPGVIWRTTHEAAALVQPDGVIADMRGAALHWGPPNDENLHWGTILGAHVGMGRLDTTPTPLPSGGAYIGGMIGPTLGLVGTYSLVAGSGDGGGAMGMAAGFGAQYWPINRLWLRAGPALLLAFDPGFANARLRPGATAGASYAFVKVGVLAVDLRFDLNAGPSTMFGTVGVGINLN